jgi:inorganic pyrophosphatase
MKAFWDRLATWDVDSGLLNIVIDTPRGSRNKYKYDAHRGVWRRSKMLPLGATFPFDFGFVPSTRGEDGDPLDVLVLSPEPTFPGCIIPGHLIGVLEAEQTEDGKTTRNDRLVAVPETPYNPPQYRDLQELGESWLAEIEHFFVAYNKMKGRQFRPLGWAGVERAAALVKGSSIHRSGRTPRARTAHHHRFKH